MVAFSLPCVSVTVGNGGAAATIATAVVWGGKVAIGTAFCAGRGVELGGGCCQADAPGWATGDTSVVTAAIGKEPCVVGGVAPAFGPFLVTAPFVVSVGGAGTV
jgi:hypothetical protein